MIDATPIAVTPTEYINPAVIQQIVIGSPNPLHILVIWPTGVQMPTEGELAEQILKAWGIMDEEGNLPESVSMALTAQKLGVNPNGGAAASLRPANGFGRPTPGGGA